MGIEIREAVVVKRGAPGALRIEAEKMARARDIGLASGLFRVPEIHECDDARGVLVMERIPGLVGFRRATFGRAEARSMLDRVGRSLAQVHQHLVLPEALRRPLPAALDQPGSAAFLHGDFSAENVCVASGGQLVLIDWQISPRCGTEENWGTRYFDVCWFVGNLFRKPAWEYLRGLPPGEAAGLFMDGYRREGGSIEPTAFVTYHRAFFDFRIGTQEKGLDLARKALLHHGFKQWEKFIEEFPARGGGDGLPRFA